MEPARGQAGASEAAPSWADVAQAWAYIAASWAELATSWASLAAAWERTRTPWMGMQGAMPMGMQMPAPPPAPASWARQAPFAAPRPPASGVEVGTTAAMPPKPHAAAMETPGAARPPTTTVGAQGMAKPRSTVAEARGAAKPHAVPPEPRSQAPAMTEEEWLSAPPAMAFAGLSEGEARSRTSRAEEDIEDLSVPAHHIAMMMLEEEGHQPVSGWDEPDEQARGSIRAESAFPPLSDGT
ncbi:hypothetical protein [Myxococcus sp. RHSTA-1-4]|uniref:hypothetical protein n=1 Tax=Myxococcus sp. RHSTA-1-4 TaxID=2874601 RepID=UPI001CBDA267|nr:hypothetical protein [Myxococcus sp. RHSTA-1-4]MBZ4418794.1 hypothetical protein [Myxococcus sp. RHSTA-1-4]